MAARRLLVLCDVDGTVTRPMKPVSEEMLRFLLDRVKPVAKLGLVGGSDYSKISKQMGPEVASQFDYVFCENGLVRYEGGQLTGSNSMVEHIGEELSQKFINFSLEYMSRLQLPAKRGNFIEFRTSMLNISPVGRSCNQREREEFAKFDEEHLVRKKFVEALKKAFPDSGLCFSLGGQISVDVFPVGWDKTFCLGHVDGQFDEIHFFGDKTTPGGNDYEIYEDPRTVGHRVTSPEDTKEQLARLLNLEA